jgi:hypothetical protein
MSKTEIVQIYALNDVYELGILCITIEFCVFMIRQSWSLFAVCEGLGGQVQAQQALPDYGRRLLGALDTVVRGQGHVDGIETLAFLI